jgi:hypothetical protein
MRLVQVVNETRYEAGHANSFDICFNEFPKLMPKLLRDLTEWERFRRIEVEKDGSEHHCHDHPQFLLRKYAMWIVFRLEWQRENTRSEVDVGKIANTEIESAYCSCMRT